MFDRFLPDRYVASTYMIDFEKFYIQFGGNGFDAG